MAVPCSSLGYDHLSRDRYRIAQSDPSPSLPCWLIKCNGRSIMATPSHRNVPFIGIASHVLNVLPFRHHIPKLYMMI